MRATKERLRGGNFAMWLIADKHPVTFAIIARVRGTITADQFQRALYGVREKYPPLTMRVNIEADGLPYLISDSDLAFPVCIRERVNAGTWEEEMAHNLAQPFDMCKEPPIRFLWLRGDDVSEIVIVCPHALADGYSAAYVIRDFLHYLGNPDASVTTVPLSPSASDLIPDFRGKWMTVFGAKMKAEFLKLPGKREPDKARLSGVEKISEKPKNYLLSWELSVEQTSALIKRCRAEGTTVHAALSVAFLRAFGEFYGGGWYRKIQSPVDLRKRLAQPVGESFGLYINLVEFFVDCEPERSFWEVAREIKRHFIQHCDDKLLFKTLLDTTVLMDSLAPVITSDTIMSHMPEVKYDLSITNLGKLNFPLQYGSLKLEALYGPVLSGIPEEIVLGVITIGGKMHFTMSYTDLKLNASQAEQISATAMEQLAEAAGW